MPSVDLCKRTSLSGQRNDDIADRLKPLEDAIRALTEQIADLNARLPSQKSAGPVETVANVVVKVSPNISHGGQNAKVVIVEFSDFECPFCARHAHTTYDQLQRDYVQTGKIRYVFKHFPLEHRHPSARKAAEAAECAAKQGKFWQYHDRVFATQAVLLPDLQRHADALALEMPDFTECLASGEMIARVSDDLAEGRRVGITATPGFVIGLLESDGTLRVTRRIVGAHPYSVFEAALNDVLSTAK